MPSTEQNTTVTEESDSISMKGIKAAQNIQIEGGEFQIDSNDDAVHANQNVTINDGKLTVQTGDDGIHADTDVSIVAGEILISKSYEGIEGINVTIAGGYIQVDAAASN